MKETVTTAVAQVRRSLARCSLATCGLLIAAALASTACSVLPRQTSMPLSVPAAVAVMVPETEISANRCTRLFSQLDAAVAAAGVADAESSRVQSFPYLRSSRFLASFAYQLTEQALPAWMNAMRRLDAEARAVELAQLSPSASLQLGAGLLPLGAPDGVSAVEACAQTLLQRDLADPDRLAQLRNAAQVPDDYLTAHRVLGAYWLTRVPFAWGVQRYQARVQASFDTPLAQLPVAGEIVSYGSMTQRHGQDVEQSAAARVLRAGSHFLSPDAADVTQLLTTHAPVFDVDAALPDDRIGTLRLDAAGQAVVATEQASVYGRVAFTRMNGQVLTQLIYTTWFTARPKTGPLDLLGGKFDALVWRVTLDQSGTPLIFDSIHACGCYHMFFPTPRMQAKTQPSTLEEWAFVPQRLPAVATGADIRLRVASRTHYLVAVQAGAGPPVQQSQARRQLTLRPESSLRLLSSADGRQRSLYGPDGLVPGSQRGERYLFWPMGVPDAGAMRQWGRHATAFVGRRHFDDAELLQRYFVWLQNPAQAHGPLVSLQP